MRCFLLKMTQIGAKITKNWWFLVNKINFFDFF